MTQREHTRLERFYASRYVWEHPEEYGGSSEDYHPEDIPKEYALRQQVLEGPNNGQRPSWFFAKKEDLEKFDAWKDLGNIEERAAIRMYMSLVDRYFPGRAKKSLAEAYEGEDTCAARLERAEYEDDLSVVASEPSCNQSTVVAITDTIHTPLVLSPVGTTDSQQQQLNLLQSDQVKKEGVDGAAGERMVVGEVQMGEVPGVSECDAASTSTKVSNLHQPMDRAQTGILETGDTVAERPVGDSLNTHLDANHFAGGTATKSFESDFVDLARELATSKTSDETSSLMSNPQQQQQQKPLEDTASIEIEETKAVQDMKADGSSQYVGTESAASLSSLGCAVQSLSSSTTEVEAPEGGGAAARGLVISSQTVVAGQSFSTNQCMEGYIGCPPGDAWDLVRAPQGAANGVSRREEELEAEVADLKRQVAALHGAELGGEERKGEVREDVAVMLVMVKDEKEGDEAAELRAELRQQEEDAMTRVREMNESRTCMAGIHRQLELELATERSIATKLKQNNVDLQVKVADLTMQVEAQTQSKNHYEEQLRASKGDLQSARAEIRRMTEEAEEMKEREEERQRLLEKEKTEYQKEAARIHDVLKEQLEVEKQEWLKGQLSERQKVEKQFREASNAERALGQEAMEEVRLEMMQMRRDIDIEQLEMQRSVSGQREQLREMEKQVKEKDKQLEEQLESLREEKAGVEEVRDNLTAELEALRESKRAKLPDIQAKDDWAMVEAVGEGPSCRYGHACSVIDTEEGHMMMVLGGRNSSKGAHDLYLLHLEPLRWVPATTTLGPTFSHQSISHPEHPDPSSPPPPYLFQGHCALPLPGCSRIGESRGPESDQQTLGEGGGGEDHLVLVLGNVPPSRDVGVGEVLRQGLGFGFKGWGGKENKVGVQAYVLNMDKLEWNKVEAVGGRGGESGSEREGQERGCEVPCGRSGHSACVINGKVWMFGGEDLQQRPLNDVNVLDLNTLEWTQPPVEPANKDHEVPCGRSGHTAVAYADRYLVIFGGGMGPSRCLNDIHILDTLSLKWFQPRTSGPTPCPRASHAAALVGDRWYILGGGNSTRALRDMSALKLTDDPTMDVLEWELVDEEMAPTAGEGLSCATIPAEGAVAESLITFGGYDGKCHADAHVYTPGPMLAAAAALRMVLGEVQGAPWHQQQEVAALLAASLIEARDHALLHEEEHFTPHLNAAKEEAALLAGIAREAAQQAAVSAIHAAEDETESVGTPQEAVINSHRAGISAVVEVAGAMTAATVLRCSAQMIRSIQQQEVAQYDANEALKRATQQQQEADQLRSEISNLESGLGKMKELEEKLNELHKMRFTQQGDTEILGLWRGMFQNSQ